jgi:hypothetical protein
MEHQKLWIRLRRIIVFPKLKVVESLLDPVVFLISTHFYPQQRWLSIVYSHILMCMTGSMCYFTLVHLCFWLAPFLFSTASITYSLLPYSHILACMTGCKCYKSLLYPEFTSIQICSICYSRPICFVFYIRSSLWESIYIFSRFTLQFCFHRLILVALHTKEWLPILTHVISIC